MVFETADAAKLSTIDFNGAALVGVVNIESIGAATGTDGRTLSVRTWFFWKRIKCFEVIQKLFKFVTLFANKRSYLTIMKCMGAFSNVFKTSELIRWLKWKRTRFTSDKVLSTVAVASRMNDMTRDYIFIYIQYVLNALGANALPFTTRLY